MDLERLAEFYPGAEIIQSDKEVFVISPLAFHAALYVNPDEHGFYTDRYCYMSIALAKVALEEYLTKTGKFRYWQKHHNKQINIDKNKAYNSGDLICEENVLFEVDWNIDELSPQYPYEKSFMDSWLEQQNN